jgi:hypothetical protein
MIHLVRRAHHFRIAHTRRAVFAMVTIGLCVALVAAFFEVGQARAASPSPSITLSPSEAVAGTAVTVDGANFTCRSVDLAFDGTSVGTASSTAKAFSARIPTPIDATFGTHMVTASCPGRKRAAQATFTVRLPSADLAVTMTGPLLGGATRSGSCSVTVSNLGPDPAGSVFIRFSTDPSVGLLFSVDRASSGTYDPVAMTWTILAMGPNQRETLDCTMAEYLDPPPLTILVFHTTAVASGFAFDPNVANNTAIVETVYAQ